MNRDQAVADMTAETVRLSLTDGDQRMRFVVPADNLAEYQASLDTMKRAIDDMRAQCGLTGTFTFDVRVVPPHGLVWRVRHWLWAHGLLSARPTI